MEMILLIGPPGSGKSTYCKEKIPEAFRISQDEMGKSEHFNIYLKALEDNLSLIVIDRVNHIQKQRNRYLAAAQKKGYQTRIIVFKTPYSVCKERLLKREGHPTIPFGNEEIALAALGNFCYQYEDVLSAEADQIIIIDE